MGKLLKYFAIILVVLIIIIAILMLIDPRLNDSHETPYLNLIDESTEPGPAEADIVQRLILFGDAGSSSLNPWQASLQKIAARAKLSPDKTAMVALGDNIYYFGYPEKESDQDEWDKGQLEDISHLDAQLKLSTETGAPLYLVPGNHDWYAEALDGMRNHIAGYAEQNSVATELRPLANSTLGAVDAVNLDGITIVFSDSSALLKTTDEELTAAMASLTQTFEQSRATHPDNVIVVVQHHPIETKGPHAGYMTHFSYWFVISVLDIFADVTSEDTTHPNYQRIIAAQSAAMAPFEKTIHAAGHDHSLQVFRRSDKLGTDYSIVSGAANTSKVSGVWHNKNTRFALSQEGFVELSVTADGSTYLQVFDIHQEAPQAGFWLAW